MFFINGIELPPPDKGLSIQRQQLVDSSRNANGRVIAQTINHRLIKLSGLKWSYLTLSQWHKILVEIEKFRGSLIYYDPLYMSYIQVYVYWGDASEEYEEINPTTGKPIAYVNCSCNIVDMGQSIKKVSI